MRPVALQPKRLALLAYLAAARPAGLQRRDVLLAVFWPELDSEHARGALSKAVHYLRQALGDGTVVRRGEEELGVSAQRLWCDVPAFERALAEGQAAEALALYGGDLLAGLHISGAPEWEQWLDGRRSALRAGAVSAALQLAEEALASGNAMAATAHARRATSLAVADEVVLRRSLELLAAAGDRSGAARLYEEFARRLASDYQLEPAAETRALVARLRRDDEDVATYVTAAHPPAAVTADTSLPHLPREAPAPAAAVRRRPPLAVAAALLLSLLVGSYLRPTEAPLETRRVVVAPFENRTGDASLNVLGQMAADWLIQGLSGSGVVEVVPFGAMLRSALNVGGEGDSATRMSALAQETGSGTAIWGSIYRQGDSLYIHARATNVRTGRVLLALDPVSTEESGVLDAVERVRTLMMGGIAPFLDPRMRDYAAIASRPPSYESYRAYAQGMERFVSADWRGAIERFHIARATDTAFALPLVMAAIAQANLGNYAAVDSLVAASAPHLHRLPEYDRLALEAAAAWSKGDYESSYRAAVRVAALAPNTIAHGQVAREALTLNRPREAVRVLRALDPARGELRGWVVYWQNLSIAHHALGEYRHELRTARRARAAHPTSPVVTQIELRALAGLRRDAAVLAAAQEYLADPPDSGPSPSVLLRTTALELRAHGRPGAARQLLELQLAWLLERPPASQSTPAFRSALAETYYLLERWEESRALLTALARENPDALAVQGRLATIAARLGERDEAQRLDAELAALVRPHLFGEQTYWRARIAALLGAEARAVHLLGEAYAEGRWERLGMHTDVDLEPVRGSAAFRSFARPRG